MGYFMCKLLVAISNSNEYKEVEMFAVKNKKWLRIFYC